RNAEISSAFAYHFLLAASNAVLSEALADFTTSAEIVIWSCNKAVSLFPASAPYTGLIALPISSWFFSNLFTAWSVPGRLSTRQHITFRVQVIWSSHNLRIFVRSSFAASEEEFISIFVFIWATESNENTIISIMAIAVQMLLNCFIVMF